MIRTLRSLFRRPSSTALEIQRAGESLTAKRLIARQWLASRKAGANWCLDPSKSPEKIEPKPRALHLVVPIQNIPTLRRAA